MNTTSISSAAQLVGNDQDYHQFLVRQRQHFEAYNKGPLFTTGVADPFGVYLAALPEEYRQYHTCHCCRRFVNRFGSLVTIDPDTGEKTPVLWSSEIGCEENHSAVTALVKAIMSAKVTGVFLSDEKAWGDPVTGIWKHMAIEKVRLDRRQKSLTAEQESAERLEDFKNMQRALGEFKADQVDTAVRILDSDVLFRTEKVSGPAKWLQAIHKIRDGVKRRDLKDNFLWLAVATAPAGFAHPRSSMIGTLLEDLAAGFEFDTVRERFAKKMHPLQYQRPQAAPSVGNLKRAEELVAKLGLEPSLHRRYATLGEIPVKFWEPRTVEGAKPSSVFGHLTPKGQASASAIELPAQNITWAKFQRDVLPNVSEIEYQIERHGSYSGCLTALNSEAPPIIQWDSLEQRNPFSYYVYHGGSAATQWNLPSGGWHPVTAILSSPSHFFSEDTHQAKEAFFVLKGARDTNAHGGNCLFPEILKSELREIRSTIEAFSLAAPRHGSEQASCCGVTFRGASVLRIRVKLPDGVKAVYDLDRWD